MPNETEGPELASLDLQTAPRSPSSPAEAWDSGLLTEKESPHKGS